MKNSKVLLIYNPHSGKGKISKNLPDIISVFSGRGMDVTAYPTKRRGDATLVTKERSKDFDYFVCAGGDGTLDEVVTGMMRADKKVPIGYIPAGSTNDFAHSIGIPDNMTSAAKAASTGNLYSCDIGSFNSGNFVYIAAFGIFTAVSYDTPQKIKNVIGYPAYILGAIKSLRKIESHKAKITVDGEVVKGDFLYGMVSNSKSAGGLKNITGNSVDLGDGRFEVTLIRKPANVFILAKIIRSLLTGKICTKYVYTKKASHVTVQSKESIPWTLDGEYGGTYTYSEISNVHAALDFLVK